MTAFYWEFTKRQGMHFHANVASAFEKLFRFTKVSREQVVQTLVYLEHGGNGMIFPLGQHVFANIFDRIAAGGPELQSGVRGSQKSV